MWDGHLGCIDKAKLHIELTAPDVSPVNSAPYRAGPKECKLEKMEMDRTLCTKVIELAKSEWASSNVFDMKKQRLLGFGIDYRKLNTMNVKDVYQISQMYECLDCLGQTSIFSTVKANFWY